MYLTSGARMSTANLAYFFAENPFVINLIAQIRDLAGASSLARRSPVASTSPASPRRSPIAGSPVPRRWLGGAAEQRLARRCSGAAAKGGAAARLPEPSLDSNPAARVPRPRSDLFELNDQRWMGCRMAQPRHSEASTSF